MIETQLRRKKTIRRLSFGFFLLLAMTVSSRLISYWMVLELPDHFLIPALILGYFSLFATLVTVVAFVLLVIQVILYLFG